MGEPMAINQLRRRRQRHWLCILSFRISCRMKGQPSVYRLTDAGGTCGHLLGLDLSSPRPAPGEQLFRSERLDLLEDFHNPGGLSLPGGVLPPPSCACISLSRLGDPFTPSPPLNNKARPSQGAWEESYSLMKR